MADSPPNVRLNLANTAENVVLVREMLSGIAQAIDLDGSDLNDARPAVTEACNNVVLHAYRGEEGPLEVEVFLFSRTLGVLVRDQGTGIAPETPQLDDTGIGLHVIQTLTRSVELEHRADGGTEVWMEFAAART